MGTSEEYQHRVGVALAAIRTYRRLTQEELAVEVGVSGQTISNYENGRNSPHAEVLVRICRAMDVPLDVLLDPPATRDEVFEALALHFARQRAGRGHG
jgi:transcriptional regulator with XRE-family HTH domain